MDELVPYEFDLPADRIAAQPVPRGTAKLMVLDRAGAGVSHRTVADLPGLLRAGDLLVLNDTRVLPAKLDGVRVATGGRWGGLFLRSDRGGDWRVLAKTRGTPTPGEVVALPAVDGDGPDLRLTLLARHGGGEWTVRPVEEVRDTPAADLLERYGRVPLPPYIPRDAPDARDREWYQTVYAGEPGSVAAPTAGLHFTPDLLDRCRANGIGTARVTLHVGVGTFRPVTAARLDDHPMHAEWCRVTDETVAAVRETRRRGGRIIAVGTTTCRTLEAAAAGGDLAAFVGETDIFLRPGHRFRAVDGLLTNFHLPRSTLLVLVSALAGRDRVMAAYDEAVRSGYRFYSYGDAMLVV